MTTVLIIDDYEDFLDTVAEYVEELGHRAEVATTVPEGLTLARTLQPDVVLCDLNVGGTMTGLTVATELGRLPSPPMLVALTGMAISGLDGIRERARAAGFSHVLRKPLSPEELAAILGIPVDRPT